MGKVTKAFLDSLYAFLDGLVHLSSDESAPVAIAKKAIGNAAAMTSNDPLALLDISDPVSCPYASLPPDQLTTMSLGHPGPLSRLELWPFDARAHPGDDKRS